jgi:hypothetical protein
MKRREFLLGAGAAAWAAQGGRSQPQAQPDGAKMARIGVSSWSFHTLFEAPRSQGGKRMDALDFPEMIADRYHVHNLEIVLPHFASSEPSYVKEFKDRLRKTHSRLLNVPLDYDELWEKPALSATDAKEREHAISLYMKGIDVAQALGSPIARCDPGLINVEDPSLTIDSYKKLVAYGKPRGVGIVVENHGSSSAHPEVMVKILKASGAGALPDIGNFPNEETRQSGLRLMFPLARGLAHAKMGPRFDMAKCIQIGTAAGFKGVFSIEAGGRGDPYQAVQQILDALIKAI